MAELAMKTSIPFLPLKADFQTARETASTLTSHLPKRRRVGRVTLNGRNILKRELKPLPF
jgi:hypothetical protein